MAEVSLRFYAELNDFLPPERQQREFGVELTAPRSVKDLVESLGVPHTEVDLIVVDGVSVDFAHPVAAGERISVYPVFEALDVSPLVRLRPGPLRETRFVLDGHLGKLAAYLRLLGFDTLYAKDARDEELARVSRAERRVLLTRDRGLLKRSEVTHGLCIRSTDPRRQLAEIVERCDLSAAAAPFTRCLKCNAPLEPVAKQAVLERLPPRVGALHEEFWRCAPCDKVYWKGTHWERMRGLVEETLARP
ncbi:MAG TPA: Mut7-C RNAse domain-containing protein [Thermoanaerobaculia bacterium]|nr:Mut7-C RNAse domain-containing protein [Thermoanaerobaculia bacterium]